MRRGRRFGQLALLLAGIAVLSLASAPRAEAFIYWADNGDNSTTIGRANNDGTGVDQGFITGAREPCGVAVDGEHIYWGNQDPPAIGRANLDGTGVDQSFVTGVGGVCGIAVDSTGIWWNNRGSPGGNIGRADLAGTDVDPDLFSSPQVQGRCGVALGPGDSPGRFLYWVNTASSPTTIGRSPVPDPLPVGSFIPQALMSPCWPAVSGSHIYWTNLTVGIVRADLDGENGESVVGSLGFGGLAISEARLYWANATEGTISGSNLDGGSPDFAFIRTGDTIRGLAVDSRGPSGGGGGGCDDLALGKAKKNKRKGTAKLTAEVGCAGALEVGGKGVKPAEKEASGAGEVKLPVKAKGKKKRKLRKKGKSKVEAEVTFTPDGGTPVTEDKKVKLVKK